MQQYIELAKEILEHGHHHSDRTGVGRISLYGRMLRWDLKEGFPLVTTRKVPYKAIIKELLWFISGSNSNQELLDQDVKIWDSWAVKEEHIDNFIAKHQHVFASENQEVLKSGLQSTFQERVGFMYGRAWRYAPADLVSMLYPDITEEDIASDKLESYREQYPEYGEGSTWEVYLKARHYDHIDQLQNLIVGLKKRPYSSRHIVSAWLPQFVPFETLSPQENVMLMKGSLAACHTMFQCFVAPPKKEGDKPKLSLMLTQRSADFLVGSAFNIAQYAILTHMLAQVCDYDVGEFIYSLGDVHIYKSQVEQAKEQLQREPKHLSKLVLNPNIKDIYKFTISDIDIVDYDSHGVINYPVAI